MILYTHTQHGNSNGRIQVVPLLPPYFNVYYVTHTVKRKTYIMIHVEKVMQHTET